MRLHTKKLAEYACLLAFAMIISYIEVLIPIPLGIPGAKLGLANVAIVFCLYRTGIGGAFIINICRVLLCGLLFGNAYGMLYSLVGAVFSLLIMACVKHIPAFGIVGVSIAGGVAHNIGQLLLALCITQVPVLCYYLPFLLIIGALTGFLNGGLANLIYSRITKHTEPNNKEKQDINVKHNL